MRPSAGPLLRLTAFCYRAPMVRFRISALLLALAGCGDSVASSDSNSGGNSGTQADTTAGECAVGFEGCPCSQMGSCLDDLVCVAGVCVGGGASATEVPTGSASESASVGTSDSTTSTTMQASASGTSSTASASASESSSSTQSSNGETESTGQTMGASVSDSVGSDTSTSGTGGTTGTSGDPSGDPDSQGESSTGASAVCGDGVAEADEECDGADLGGKTCSSFNFKYGKLGCTPACAADTSKCTNSAACSDGVLAPNVLCYAPPKLLTGVDQQSRQVGDFDEDGHLDIVALMGDDPWVVLVRFGNGDGTFKPQALQSPGLPKLAPKRVVDLDKDGHLDVVGTVSGQVRVALGDGTGKLTASFDYDAYAGTRIELIDVTEDGWFDMATCGSAKVTRFRRGQPDGLFGPSVSYPADPAYETGTCGFADIDADGFLDMWTGAGPNFYWWHGDGDGNFVVDPVVTKIAVGDFAAVTLLDDDEYPDIAGWSNSGADLRVRLGSPLGFTGMLYTYPLEHGATTNYHADARMIGNFDGNDIPDIVAYDRTVADVFRGDGTGLFYDGVGLGYMIKDIQGIAVGDFNEDGLDDFILGYLVNFGDTTDYIVLSDP